MKKNYILPLFFFVTLLSHTISSYAVEPSSAAKSAARRCFGMAGEQAFAPGEELKYTVNYSAAVISANVADVTIKTSLERIENTTCYKIWALGKTRKFYSMFFELEDHYITWLDTATLRPLVAKSDLKEGGYLYNTNFKFHWPSQTVNTVGHNVKNKNTYRKLMPIGPCSYDAIGLFYNMRQIDSRELNRSKHIKLSLVLEDTVRNITLRYMGIENYKIANIGEFRCRKFACQFATSSEESFKDGDEFFVWITDDKNKIPVYIQSPIRVGTINVALSSWSGLMHPLSSIVIPAN